MLLSLDLWVNRVIWYNSLFLLIKNIISKNVIFIAQHFRKQGYKVTLKTIKKINQRIKTLIWKWLLHCIEHCKINHDELKNIAIQTYL